MSWYEGFEHIVRETEPLAPYVWFRLGGTAEFFAEPTSVDELGQLVKKCKEHDLPLRVIGGGSSILVPDDGVKGLVVCLSAPAFGEISIDGPRVVAGGGAKLSHVISSTVRDGLAGLESLVGIPGTVAGALHANADCRGSSIGQWTDSVTVMDRAGEVATRSREEIRFGYRKASLDDVIVLQACFQLDPADSVELTRRMQKSWIIKRANEPSTEERTGRIFADPQGMSAAELIEQAGVRGSRVGGVAISERHANFIVAEDGATAADVCALIETIQAKVNQQLGVQLQPEIQVW